MCKGPCHRLRIHLLTSSGVQTSAHPDDGASFHQSKERLINCCTRSCRQKIGTGKYRPLGLVCDALLNNFRRTHVRSYVCFSYFVNI
jgi:hypothetical protein